MWNEECGIYYRLRYFQSAKVIQSDNNVYFRLRIGSILLKQLSYTYLSCICWCYYVERLLMMILKALSPLEIV